MAPVLFRGLFTRRLEDLSLLKDSFMSFSVSGAGSAVFGRSGHWRLFDRLASFRKLGCGISH